MIKDALARNIFKNIKEPALILCAKSGRTIIEAVNKSYSDLMGLSEEKLLGSDLFSIIEVDEGMQNLRSSINKTEEDSKEERLILRNYFPKSSSASHQNGSVAVENVWLSSDQKTGKFILHTVNSDPVLTKKQFAEDRLKVSEQRFRTLVQDGSDLIAILDSSGNYLYVSPTSQTVLGTPPKEYLGKNAFDFIHPSDREKVIEGFEKLKTNHKVDLAAFRFLHHDRSWRWIETVITDLTNDPAVNGIVANSRDITQKINRQKDIVLSNERYRFATMATSDAIWDWDLETNRIYWGDGFQRIFHWERTQLCSDINTWAKLVHPEDLLRVEKKLYALLESSENQWSDEYRFAKSDQEFAVVADRAFVVRDHNGNAIRVVGAMHDISWKRKKELQVKLLESVVTQTNELIMITEAEPVGNQGRLIIYVNEAFCRLTGYASEELIGKTPSMLHGEKTNGKELAKLRKALGKRESCEVSVINYKKNGEEFWNNFSVCPVVDEFGLYSHCISIGRDLSNVINLQKQERLMYSISQIFNTTEGLVDAMDKTLKLLTKSGKYEHAEIWMLDHDGSHLSLIAHHTLDFEREIVYRGKDSFIKVVKSQGFSGEVWKWGKGQSRPVSENNDEHLAWRTSPDSPIAVLFGLPIFYNKELISVLVLGSRDKEVQLGVYALSTKFGVHLAGEIRRKQVEEELRQIFTFVPDIITISDFAGYIKKINPAATVLLGYSAKELIAKPFVDFLHPQDRKAAVERMQHSGNTRCTHVMEERYLTKTGKVKWLAWTSHAIEDRGLIFSVGKDITDKKNLEELLRRSNSLAKVGSWEINVVEGTVYWSDVTKEIREVDLSFEPDLNTGIENFRKEVDRITIKKKVEECICSGSPWDEELEILTFKGNPKWVRTIGQAEMIDGKCIRIFGSFQDIDVRKRAEIEAKVALKELEESEKRYSDLFHLSPNPMLVYNNDSFQFIDVNEAALSHYGYSYAEFMGMTLKHIRPETEFLAFEDAVKQIRKNDCRFFQGVFKHEKKNGEVIDVEIKSNIVNFKGKEARVSLINDVTERQKYFNALEKQNSILKEISWVQSHVVRAPLAKLMGLVALLSKRSMQNIEKQQLLVENIEHCTAQLDEIIRDITKKSEQQEKLSRG